MAINETIKEFLKDKLGCPKEFFDAPTQPESPSQQTLTSFTQSPLSVSDQSASESPKFDKTSIAASTSGSPRQQNPKFKHTPPKKPLPPLPSQKTATI